ncbi:MAG: 1-acyl-sn-glycerol-3-phosphate acyltransferase [Pseudomonadota bacterium]
MAAPNEISLRDYRVSFATADDHWAFRHAFRSLEALFGAWSWARLSQRVHAETAPGDCVWSTYLRLVGAKAEAIGDGISAIPRAGPVVFVANHPTGIPDAAILGDLIHRHIRTDALFISFRPFAEMPTVADRSIAIDLPSPSGRVRPGAERNLARCFAKARRHLRDGGSIVAFPAGPIAERTESGDVIDGPWRKAVFKLATDTDAAVAPVFVGARMSPLRRTCQKLSPILFHASAVHEVRHIRRRRAAAVFGRPIVLEHLAQQRPGIDIAQAMRETTYALEAMIDTTVAPLAPRGLANRRRAQGA